MISLTEVANSLVKKRNVQNDGDDSPMKTDVNEPPRREVVDLSFSRDNKHIAFVISDGHNNTQAVIYEWNTQKQKVIASCDFSGMNFQINRISFSPKDSQLVCTSGPGHWKVWRVNEGTFKQLPQF